MTITATLTRTATARTPTHMPTATPAATITARMHMHMHMHMRSTPIGSTVTAKRGTTTPAGIMGRMRTTITEDPGILPLFCWLSPLFPVGAYAYSHGLEWAVEAGDVGDEASLRERLRDLLRDGIGRNDAILLARAWDAAGDARRLDEVNALALALAPSAEFRLETAQQGRSFLDAALAAWPRPLLVRAGADLREVALPVAVGIASAAHGVSRDVTVQAYLTSLLQNLVSAAIRLAPIGQTAGQRVLAALLPEIMQLAEDVLPLDLDDVGGATFRADLGSLRHETQYTRLFRS